MPNQVAPSHVYAVILAGGSGTRFWPKSRLTRPKQLCAIGDNSLTMIEQTLARLDGLIPVERRIVVTHEQQLLATRDICASRCKYFIGEPEARNTAAALTLAALEIAKLSANAANPPVMVSLHADHIISDEAAFRNDIMNAVAVAEQGYLTLMGIKPTRPATGFGYIEQGTALPSAKHGQGYTVASFREKPQLDLAKQYLARGNFYWNSGYFIWQIETLVSALREHLPQTLAALTKLAEDSNKLFSAMTPKELGPTYSTLAKVAIDTAILEVSQNVAFVPTSFGWHDIGSWDALEQCLTTDKNGNVKLGDSLLLESSGCIVSAENLFIAGIGLQDLVVVQSGNAILVCPKSRAEEVKKVVEYLQSQGRDDLIK